MSFKDEIPSSYHVGCQAIVFLAITTPLTPLRMLSLHTRCKIRTCGLEIRNFAKKARENVVRWKRRKDRGRTKWIIAVELA